jgi:hypothetical protein
MADHRAEQVGDFLDAGEGRGVKFRVSVPFSKFPNYLIMQKFSACSSALSGY